MDEKQSSCSAATTRHMQTEKRRRDRIASGFDTLRELVPCKDRKLDKATFLQEVVDYVGHLQAVVQQALSLGSLNALSEEAQWQVRLLLPRQGANTPVASEAAQVDVLSDEGRLINTEEGLVLSRNPGVGELDTVAGSGLQGNFEQKTQLQSGPIEASERPEPSRIGGNIEEAHVCQRNVADAVLCASMPRRAPAPGSKQHVDQLQHIVRQLQSQQALGAQQLQVQQTAVAQSQMYHTLQLQQLGKQKSAEKLKLQPASQAAKHQGPENGQTNVVSEEQLPQEALESAHKPVRRNLKIRKHTTAAKISNPHSNPSSNSSSGSPGASAGRPEMALSRP